MNIQNNQQGVVLIITLVMLLLITVIGISAIQQNKLQFSMTGNAQEQGRSLALAENALLVAESVIDKTRWTSGRYNWAPGDATNGAGLYGNDTDNNTVNNSNITSDWECVVSGGRPDMINVGTVLEDGATIANVTSSIQGWWCKDSGESCTASSCPSTTPTSFCGTEVYTINTVFIDNDTGALRILESKYAVHCES